MKNPSRFLTRRGEQYFHALSQNDELKLELSRRRMELRRLDAELADQRRDRLFFHRVGFGRDFKDIQLMAIQDQRDCLARETEELEKRVQPQAPRRGDRSGWLLLPLVVALAVLQPLRPRRASTQAVRTRPAVASPGPASLAS